MYQEFSPNILKRILITCLYTKQLQKQLLFYSFMQHSYNSNGSKQMTKCIKLEAHHHIASTWSEKNPKKESISLDKHADIYKVCKYTSNIV